MLRVERPSGSQTGRAIRHPPRGLAGAGAALAFFAILSLASLLTAQPASAVPSFARQTGQPCAACHTAFPELTPFGRRFKLSGYTLQGGDSKLPPIAAMIMPGFTHTQAPYDPPGGAAPPPAGLKTNDNLVTKQVTGLLAGQIYGNLGSFIQVSGNPVTGQTWFDASDVRYVDTFKLFGADAYFGVTVNNTPTVQDAWNTTDAWAFPELSSGIAPAFKPPGTHIDALAQVVAGAGAYVFWNDVLYAELTAYGGYDKSTLEAFGMMPGSTPDSQVGVQPYWRIALEPHWGDHYLMIGTFGMYGRTAPGGVFTFGTDDYTDVGFDSQYQYDGDKYSVTVKLSDIVEYQRFNASSVISGTNLNDRLNSFKANASFVWDHTYSFTAGYFDVTGTPDVNLYGSSVTGSPNGEGLIFDVAYLPFSHGSPGPYSTYNARIGIQYVQYLNLYGGTTDFDGTGLGGMHNASGDNTLFLYAWAAF
ncbi:MAG: cytochrome C [Roseiarcus sp.]